MQRLKYQGSPFSLRAKKEETGKKRLRIRVFGLESGVSNTGSSNKSRVALTSEMGGSG